MSTSDCRAIWVLVQWFYFIFYDSDTYLQWERQGERDREGERQAGLWERQGERERGGEGERGWERQGERERDRERQGEMDREWEQQSSPFSSRDLWPLWALRLALHHRFHTSPCSYCNPSKLACRSSARSKSDQVAHIGCREWLFGPHPLEPISVFSALSKGHRHRWSYRPTVQSVA